jgi:hypothetical protein
MARDIKVRFLKQAPAEFEGWGEVSLVSEYELPELQKHFDIEVLSKTEPVKSDTPDDSWTKVEIKEYLDSKSVSYSAKDNKETLLAKV